MPVSDNEIEDPVRKPAIARTAAPAVVCRFCGSPLIVPGARKCKECSEFQRWWEVALSRLSLDDFALLLSVGALALVTLKSLLGVAQAELDLKVVSCTKSQIELAAFNSGSASGILSSLQLVIVPGDASNSSTPIATYPAGAKIAGEPAGAVLVQPNEAQLLSVDVTSSLKNGFVPECQVRVTGKKFEASVIDGTPLDTAGCTCADLI